jgi:protein transport protein HofC
MADPDEKPLATHEGYWEADESEPAAPARPQENVGLDQAGYEKSRLRPLRLTHLMILVAAVAVFLWLGILLATTFAIALVLFGALGILVFTLVMGAVVILARQASTRQDSLLSLLAIAADRNMPMAPAVAAFADQYRGFYYRRVMDLASHLHFGILLPEALERSRKVVSRDATLLAWVGQATGTLPKALRMASEARSSFLSLWTAIAARIAYVIMLLLGMQTISGFVLYYVIPKFKAITDSFGMGLPAITEAVVGFSDVLVRYAFPLALIPLAEVAVLFLLPLSFLSWGNYNVPVFDRLLGRRHTALILRALSLVVEGGKPISEGLSILARHYPTFWIHRRLRKVESDVRQGTDWIQALLRRRLIRTADAEVLTSAAKVGNLAWALAELANSAERRLATRSQIVVQTVFPLVILMLGLAVFIMVVAYFMPLVQLIHGMTDS